MGAKSMVDLKPLNRLEEDQSSVTDPFFFVPARFMDLQTIHEKFSVLSVSQSCAVAGEVKVKNLYDASRQITMDPRRGVRLFVVLQDCEGESLILTVFGRPGFTWKDVKVGQRLVVYGQIDPNPKGGLQMVSPDRVPAEQLGKIVPVYLKSGTVSGARLLAGLQKVASLESLEAAGTRLEDEVGGWSDSIVLATKFKSGAGLLKSLHWPKSLQAAQAALRASRMLNAIGLLEGARRRAGQKVQCAESQIGCSDTFQGQCEAVASRYEYPLTRCQASAIRGIAKILSSQEVLDGVLCGDVGTGKTLTFLIPALAMAQMGKRSVLMVPNLLLVHQIVREARALLPGVPVVGITGYEIDGVIQEVVDRGGVLVGTIALCFAAERGEIPFKPDYLVVDEQHKFSVAQRNLLRGPSTNYLESTATPIPRTAALVLHAGKPVFRLTDSPVNKTIHTRTVATIEEKREVMAKLRGVLEYGGTAAVIYPLVEESETVNAKSVIDAAGAWEKVIAPHETAVLHGALSEQVKGDLIADCIAGKRRLILSSLVIEVGVTIPGLNFLVVSGAERFGAVQLHQLRGRLARKGGVGYFFMIPSDGAFETCRARLRMLEETDNGFELAEKDAALRGYGDVLGDGAQKGATSSVFKNVQIGPEDIDFAQSLQG